jgi:sporulation protein YunB
MGAVFGNSFLANLGPQIPIRFNLVGNIKSNLKSSITNYGINNALIETVIHLALSVKIILPISAKEVTIESDIPISMKMITGKVPQVYMNGYNQTSPILTLPVQ